MGLLVQDDKEMSGQQPRQREEQNCDRLFVQAEAKEHSETADIHRIADESVRTGGNEIARWVEWRGRAFPASDEGRHADGCQCSTGNHQNDAQGPRPVGQCDAKRNVVAMVQVQGDPAPQKNKSGAKDCSAKCDEQCFHGVAFLKVSNYFIQLPMSLMLIF